MNQHHQKVQNITSLLQVARDLINTMEPGSLTKFESNNFIEPALTDLIKTFSYIRNGVELAEVSLDPGELEKVKITRKYFEAFLQEEDFKGVKDSVYVREKATYIALAIGKAKEDQTFINTVDDELETWFLYDELLSDWLDYEANKYPVRY